MTIGLAALVALALGAVDSYISGKAIREGALEDFSFARRVGPVKRFMAWSVLVFLGWWLDSLDSLAIMLLGAGLAVLWNVRVLRRHRKRQRFVRR